MLFLIIFLLMVSPAHASFWYIMDKDENVIAKQNGEPKIESLKDGWFFIKSEDDIDLLVAEYRNKKIQEHKPTKSEADAVSKATTDKTSAISKLKALGLTDDEILSIIK